MEFIKFQSQSFECFWRFKASVEKQTGCNIKVLCTDRGGRLLSKEFNNYYEEHGIHQELTAPYTLE